MLTARLLAPVLGTLLAVGALATLSGAPSAVAGPNDRDDWSGQRAMNVRENGEETVRILTDRGKNRWALLARQIEQPVDAPELWKLREYRGAQETGFDWQRPLNAPVEVNWFRSSQSLLGRVAAAWVHEGGLWAGMKSARVTGAGVMGVVRLGDAVPGAGAPRVYPAPHSQELLVDYAGTWYQYLPGPPRGCNGCEGAAHWISTNHTVPAGAPADPALAWSGNGGLLAFWNGDSRIPGDQSLRYARRVLTGPSGEVWTEPQVITSDPQQVVALTPTVLGERLITLGQEGEVAMFEHRIDPVQSLGFENRRDLAGPVSTGPRSAPQVLVDGMGNLTVAWRERDRIVGGLVAWQEDRPGSKFLEAPTLVPGTRNAAASLVVSHYGTLTMVAQPGGTRRGVKPLRVSHLRSGTGQWTDPIRLASPKPPDTRGAFSVGQPRVTGDVWIAANDSAGVWVHQFDAPKQAATRVTRPDRTTQPHRTYTVGWKTTWAYAVDHEVRARVDKRLGWQDLAVPKGARSKTVTRPVGEKRCYQARGILQNGLRTDWSQQRCVTVRR